MFFKKTRQIKKMIGTGGNFKYIAQNVATIYFVLETYYKKGLRERNQLFATALFDLMQYLQDGDIGVQEIEKIVSDALSREKSLPVFYSNYRKLLSLTCCIEEFCFETSTNIDWFEIRKQVEQNIPVIYEVISKTMKDGQGSSLFENIYGNVSAWISNPEIYKIIINR